MKKMYWYMLLCVLFAGHLAAKNYSAGFMNGSPEIKSMSALAFGPEGILFISDSKSAAVFAIELDDKAPNASKEKLEVKNIESKIASLLGTTADEIVIHDLAVNPISQNTYISVSRGRTNWTSAWQLPNDLEDARILLKINGAGEFEEVSLENISYSMAAIPDPASSEKEHRWKKGVTLRVDTVTDMVYNDGKVYVAGLSNEEFASTLRVIPFPFNDSVTSTSLEIYHAAHGKYETHAPVRTFLPYTFDNKPHLLASYLCTPLVTFPEDALKNGAHLKGKTVAELGYGNYPLDMVTYQKEGKEYILIANTRRALMRIDPADIEKQESITTPISDEGPFTSGVPFTQFPSSGIQQLDNLNEYYVLVLQRMPSGTLDLVSLSTKRL